MGSPVAAAKPPLDWKEPIPSPRHRQQQQPPLPPSSCSLSLSPNIINNNNNNNNASNSGTVGSSNGNSNGGLPGAAAVKTIPRSDANPYPTTFVQADTSSFKQVVQMLTGSSETAAKHAAAASSPRPAAADLASPRPHPLPPQQQQNQPPPPTAVPPSLKNSAIPTGPKRPTFKLYERRSSFKNLRINPLVPGLFNGVVLSSGPGGSTASTPNSPTVSWNSATTTPTHTGFSPRYKPEILSPSILDFPSLTLSPVTPLSPDPFNRPPTTSASSTPHSSSSSSAEDRAIAEKGFYLHPSPRSSLGAEPPRLLPLFPLTSPRVPAPASAPAAAADSSA